MLPKIKYSMERWNASLWPTYIGEKGRTLCKTYGIKTRCYWEHPWGTHWEHRKHIRKMKRTSWEQRKNEKKSYPSPSPKLKRK
jgi:hypothetical protein